jgi:hypothetical protein
MSVQAWIDPEGSRRLRLSDFMMIGTWSGAYGGGERRAQGFGGEAWGKETIGETQT